MAESGEKPSRRKRIITRTLLIGIAFALGFAVLGVIAIQVWEFSNSLTFCADGCHDVHPEEIHAFKDSYHANVKCTECHMGRVGTLESIVQKASHFRHLPEVIFDQYDRPLESATMRPANESCEGCHWPPAFHGDTVREVVRFRPDEENTEERTYLVLKTGAGNRAEGLGEGIHWHITNPVEYVATDEHKQDIRWIGTTLPDGRTVEYVDAGNPLTAEEIAQAEPRTMDCVDCHNRMGHPFPSPGDLIHRAMEDGQLSTDLPYAKQFLIDLLRADYESQEAALAAVSTLEETYAAEYPEEAAAYQAELEQAQVVAEELVTQLYFEEPGVTWQSFPDNNKHKDFAGCFRCHDGNHVTAEGEPVRLHCNICHSIPDTVGAGDRPPSLPITTIQEPPSHLETNFMADHRFQATESCEECHGEVQFGTDDSSFCANSACHDRSWPLVDLDAHFEHPINLEGNHSEVWCHDCHEGERKPEFQCANCHEPPTEPHFGPACEDCHSPEGFQEAAWGDFEHPVPLEGAHITLDCASCHADGQALSSECAGCHQPPGEDHFGPACEDCHSPEGFDKAEVADIDHPMPLEGAHATASCGDCHSGGQEPTPECASCHQPPGDDHYGSDCEDCHSPSGFAGARIPVESHPVPLEGAHQSAACEGCHTDGAEKPSTICTDCHQPPEDHLEGECDICHTPVGFARSASFLVSLAPHVPHELSGREECLVCHDPVGEMMPAPSNHVDYANEQCTLCHKVAP